MALQPDNGGELRVPLHGAVTLTLSDGRRLIVASSTETPGATKLMCRTRNQDHSDGTYASPCRLQAFVVRGRAVWIEVIGEDYVGTAVSGSKRWLVLGDGTALPLPKAPRLPAVNCHGLDGATRVTVFTRVHHLVRVEVNEDGTLARVDCLTSLVKP